MKGSGRRQLSHVNRGGGGGNARTAASGHTVIPVPSPPTEGVPFAGGAGGLRHRWVGRRKDLKGRDIGTGHKRIQEWLLCQVGICIGFQCKGLGTGLHLLLQLPKPIGLFSPPGPGIRFLAAGLEIPVRMPQGIPGLSRHEKDVGIMPITIGMLDPRPGFRLLHCTKHTVEQGLFNHEVPLLMSLMSF